MKRKQLTLFLDGPDSIQIETIRRKFNPKQYKLIKSHITLCREDELDQINNIQNNLDGIQMYEFEMLTNGLKRFSDGKGVLLSVRDEENRFGRLRELVLKNGKNIPRDHEAHITLMHPRNSTCDDEKFKELKKFELPKSLRIKRISLIEQENGKEWKTLKEYELKKKSKN